MLVFKDVLLCANFDKGLTCARENIPKTAMQRSLYSPGKLAQSTGILNVTV